MMPLAGGETSPAWLRRTATALAVLLTVALVAGYLSYGLQRPSCPDVDGKQVTSRWSWTEATWSCPLPAGSGLNV